MDSAQTNSPSTSPADKANRIIGDFACLRCGYNLRTMSLQGRCPECDLPVERSAGGNLLRCCDPAWLRRMARGAAWLAPGIGLEAIATLLGLAVAYHGWIGRIVVSLQSAFRSPAQVVGSATGPLDLSLAALTPLVLGAITLVGLLEITSREPAQPRRGPIGIRAFICSAYVAQCILSAAATSLVFASGFREDPPPIAFDLQAISSVLAAVALSAILVRGRGLAQRIPDRRLDRRTFLLLVFVIVLAVLVFSIWLLTRWSAIWLSTPGTPRTGPDEGGWVGAVFVIIAGKVGGVVGTILLGMLVLLARLEGVRLALSFHKAFMAALQQREADFALASELH